MPTSASADFQVYQALFTGAASNEWILTVESRQAGYLLNFPKILCMMEGSFQEFCPNDFSIVKFAQAFLVPD